jgi:hypothetical protein
MIINITFINYKQKSIFPYKNTSYANRLYMTQNPNNKSIAGWLELW